MIRGEALSASIRTASGSDAISSGPTCTALYTFDEERHEKRQTPILDVELASGVHSYLNLLPSRQKVSFGLGGEMRQIHMPNTASKEREDRACLDLPAYRVDGQILKLSIVDSRIDLKGNEPERRDGQLHEGPLCFDPNGLKRWIPRYLDLQPSPIRSADHR